MSTKARRARGSTNKQRVIIMLYNKVCDIVSNISELLEIQLLTDTTILQVRPCAKTSPELSPQETLAHHRKHRSFKRQYLKYGMCNYEGYL